MGKAETNFDWIISVRFDGRPSHVEILDRLEAAIRGGELQSGDRLPAQRQLAAQLDVDLTTVTRAYSAARARGLVEGTVGRGTFVCDNLGDSSALLADLATNDPPVPKEIGAAGLLAETAATLAKNSSFNSLMSLRRFFSSSSTNTQAVRWLEPFLGPIRGDRIITAPGAQPSLAAVLTMLCRPGDAIVTDQLTHRGLIWLAAKFGWRLVPCPGDGSGLLPEALERICATEHPVALYVIPTSHNPTAVTMPLERRRAIADIAKASDLWIVEADPYSPLMSSPPPAIASLAPEKTFYFSTLSKAFGAGFRIAYLVPPDGWSDPTFESLRALTLGPAPLMSAIFTRWLEDGLAQRVLEATRAEVRARRSMAAALLPQAQGGAESSHLWIPLPSSRVSERTLLVAQERGVALATEEGFIVDPNASPGIRLTLGGVAERSTLEQALRTVADILEQATPTPSMFLL